MCGITIFFFFFVENNHSAMKAKRRKNDLRMCDKVTVSEFLKPNLRLQITFQNLKLKAS